MADETLDFKATFDDSDVLKSLKRIEKETGEVARNANESFSDIGKDLSFAKVESALGGITKGTGAAALALGGVATAAAAMGAAVAAAFAAAATESLKFADSVNGAMDRVAKSTNLSAAELEQFKEDSLDVFAGDPAQGIAAAGENIEDVTRAMSALQQATGLTGDALKEATREALGLRENLDIDITRLSGAAGAALAAGLVGDVSEAFDLMAASQAQFGERAEDVVDTVREYSQDFSDLGFNAQTTFNFLSRGLEAGARNTDVLADSLQEFSINLGDAARLEQLDEISPRLGAIGRAFSEGKITGVDALGAIGDEVRGLDDQLERNEALRLTFGSIFEDMGETATLALTEVGASLDSIDGSAAKTTEAGTSLAASWDAAMRQFLVASEPAAQVILPLIAEGAQEVGKFFQEASPIFLEFAENLDAVAGPSLEKIIDALNRIAISFGLVQEEAEGMDSAIEVLEVFLDTVVAAVEAVATLAQGIAFLNETAQTISGISGIKKAFGAASEQELGVFGLLPEEEEPTIDSSSVIEKDTEATRTNTKAKDENTQARKKNVDQIIDASLATVAATENEEKATEALEKITDAEEKAASKREDIASDLKEKLSDIEIDIGRKRIDAAVSAAQKREDIARKNAQAIEDINRKNTDRIEDASKDLGRKEADLARKQGQERQDLERDTANSRVDIETDFRRRVQDIQSQFAQSAEDAERNRDAVAFLRARDQAQSEISEAQSARDESIQDLATETESRREELSIRQAREREEAQIANKRKLEDLRLQLERELEAQRIKDERATEEAAIAEEIKNQQINTQQERAIEDAKLASERKLADLDQSLEQEKQSIINALDEEIQALVRAEQEKTQAAKQGSQERIRIAQEESQAIQRAIQATASANQGQSLGLSPRRGRQSGGFVGAGQPFRALEDNRLEGFQPTLSQVAFPITGQEGTFASNVSGQVIPGNQLLRDFGPANNTTNVDNSRKQNISVGVVDPENLDPIITSRARIAALQVAEELS